MCHHTHCHAHTMCTLPAFARVQPTSFLNVHFRGGLMWTPVCTLKLTMPSLALHRFGGQGQLVHITLDKFYRKLKVSSELPCTPKKFLGLREPKPGHDCEQAVVGDSLILTTRGSLPCTYIQVDSCSYCLPPSKCSCHVRKSKARHRT